MKKREKHRGVTGDRSHQKLEMEYRRRNTARERKKTPSSLLYLLDKRPGEGNNHLTTTKENPINASTTLRSGNATHQKGTGEKNKAEK